MQISITDRSKWRGKVVVVPVASGWYDGPSAKAWSVQRMKIGESVGETVFVQAGGRQILLISMGEAKKLTTDTFRRVGGVAAKVLAQRQLTHAGLDATAAESSDCPGALAALGEGLILGAFRFDEYKSEKKRSRRASVELLAGRVTKTAGAELTRARQMAEAALLTREISHQPPNVIYPASLAARAKKLASTCGLKCTVLDEAQLKRLKTGGILGVGQGSDRPPRLIILQHRGSGTGKPVVLVGKAITFDTGGYSLKNTENILGMKYDKCGGAAVLGIMQAVASLKTKVSVIGVIAAAENMISGRAYRPDDIITTMSGKTVEIVSADAEGRMVLCDALTYAQKQYKPRAIIDLATLTGGVVVALGAHRAGVFCNNDKLQQALIESGDRTHERLWPLPIDDEYLEAIKGTDSDLKNSGGRGAHATLGAMFLKQFVDAKMPWAHLDIAGVADVEKDTDYCPRGATGFGVRLLADYLDRLSG